MRANAAELIELIKLSYSLTNRFACMSVYTKKQKLDTSEKFLISLESIRMERTNQNKGHHFLAKMENIFIIVA